MKKIYVKMIAITLMLMISVAIVVMSSYAWLVLSSSPAAEGIQITIAGGNTILVAADMKAEKNGTVYHHPGKFSDTLNFIQHDSYDYLNDLGGLTPVSTADGLNWFIPTYYDLTDSEVTDGSILAGTIKSVEEFVIDDSLKYANLGSGEKALMEDGSYIYLDFWVVSPGMNYTLRVSTGEDSNGSFAIGLMSAENSEGGYALAAGEKDASASVRVGFLVNPDTLIDGSAEVYQKTGYASELYTELKGSYTEPDGAQVYSSNYSFMIYEPNGDYHPGGAAEEGSYVLTQPLELYNGVVIYSDISDRLTVQLRNHWAPALDGTGQTQIEQRFQTYIAGKSLEGMDGMEISRDFYREYLDGQVAHYVSNGWFIKNTENLYNSAGISPETVSGEESADSDVSGDTGEEAQSADDADEAELRDDVVRAEYLGSGFIAGATDDVYITELEENIPQRIRMFIWLEGQDVDCVNGIMASDLAISIELAGSNQNLE